MGAVRRVAGVARRANDQREDRQGAGRIEDDDEKPMSTLTELQQLLHDKYNIEIDSIGPDAAMQDSGMDSLAIAEFMFAVEDHFHITLPDDDPNINTLAQLAALIDQVKAAPPKSATPGAGAPIAPAPAPSPVTEEK